MLVLMACVLYTSYTDLRHRIIPNRCLLILASYGLLFHLIEATPKISSFIYSYFPWLEKLFQAPLEECLLLATLIVLLGAILEYTARHFGHSLLGMGDIKYFAALACIFGICSIFVIQLSCIASYIAGRISGQKKLAMAPYIGGAAVLLAFCCIFSSELGSCC